MKKILFILSFLLALFTASGQGGVPQEISTWYLYKRGGSTITLEIPVDTFAVPAGRRLYPHIAGKDTTFYLWSTSLQKWVIAGSSFGSGGAGGADSSVFETQYHASITYALLNHTHTFASLTSKPTTLAGFGITDAAPLLHTHTSGQITDFTTAGRNLFSGGTGISYNPSTGVISTTGGSGGAYVFNTPLSESSGTVTMQQAGSGQSGYLSATDWALFNGKLSPADTANKWVTTIAKNAGGDSVIFWIGGVRYAIADRGFVSPATTVGDMLYQGASGLTRLPIGPNGYSISVVGGVPVWVNGNPWSGTYANTSTTTAATLNLSTTSTVIKYTGTAPATWTLPDRATATAKTIEAKNGSDTTLTIKRAGTDKIWTNSAVDSITLSPGESVKFVSLPSYWDVFYMGTYTPLAGLVTTDTSDVLATDDLKTAIGKLAARINRPFYIDSTLKGSGTQADPLGVNTANVGGGSGSVTTDATPTNGSTNPVQSDGVYDALALKADKTALSDTANTLRALIAAKSAGTLSDGWHLVGTDIAVGATTIPYTNVSGYKARLQVNNQSIPNKDLGSGRPYFIKDESSNTIYLYNITLVANDIVHTEWYDSIGTATVSAGAGSGTEVLDFTVNSYATNTAGSGQINFTSTANSGTGTANRKFTGDGYYQLKPMIGNTTYTIRATMTNNANTYRVEFDGAAGTITESYNGTGQGQQTSQTTNINTNYYRIEVTGTTIKLTTSATEGGTYSTVFTWSQAGGSSVASTLSVSGNGPGGTTNNFSAAKINGASLSNNP